MTLTRISNWLHHLFVWFFVRCHHCDGAFGWREDRVVVGPNKNRKRFHTSCYDLWLNPHRGVTRHRIMVSGPKLSFGAFTHGRNPGDGQP
jgi:hypothetical protein